MPGNLLNTLEGLVLVILPAGGRLILLLLSALSSEVALLPLLDPDPCVVSSSPAKLVLLGSSDPLLELELDDSAEGCMLIVRARLRKLAVAEIRGRGEAASSSSL